MQGNLIDENKPQVTVKVIAFDFWDTLVDFYHPMYDYIKKHGLDSEEYSHLIHSLIIEHDLGKFTEKEFLEKDLLLL